MGLFMCEFNANEFKKAYTNAECRHVEIPIQDLFVNFTLIECNLSENPKV